MSSRKQRIGMIGLGLMGSAFVTRLLECDFEVCAFDLDADKVDEAVKLGVSPARNAREVAQSCDIVLVCVVSTQAVRDVVLGVDGVASGAGNNTLVIDLSTTVVADTVEVAALLEGRSGAGWIDAPVSGGPPAARGGTLAVMAGGSLENINKARPVMDTLAATFTHMGEIGAGQTTKMINQVLVLNNYAVLAEACALAEAGGIDAAKIPAALGSGHAGSRLLDAMFPRLIARDFAPAGYARQVLKDLDMVQDLARSVKVPTPMTAQATSLFRLLVSKGHGELDGIAVLKLFAPDEHV